MYNPSEDVEAMRWIDKYVRRVVRDELNSMGIPRLFISGVVNATRVVSGKTYADVYLNGSSTLTTNVPVNPDIVSNITANTPVWVFAINFNNLDLYVAMRKLA
jgi:hypothetical protein